MSFADITGMSDIPRISCQELNKDMSDRVLSFHQVCRTHYPKHLKFHFGGNIDNDDDNPSPLSAILRARRGVNDADLRTIFTGEGTAASANDPPLLTLLKTLAADIVRKTITEKDSTMLQETNNLVSLIGQKSAEMYLINLLIEKEVQDLTDFLDNVFTSHDGNILLNEVDIREGANLVEVSRTIWQIMIEAEQFERNFCRKNSRIPKSYFSKKHMLSMADKADIFAIHHIKQSKAQVKTINQSLKRNHSFKAFSVPVLTTIERLKTRKLLEVLTMEELNNDGRRKKKYKITYDMNDTYHSDFLEKYQALYPGNIL